MGSARSRPPDGGRHDLLVDLGARRLARDRRRGGRGDRVPVDAPVVVDPVTPTLRIEVWNARPAKRRCGECGRVLTKPERGKWSGGSWFASGGVFFEWAEALRAVDWRRRTIRVRTFYDRRLRLRVTQILAGSGLGVR